MTQLFINQRSSALSDPLRNFRFLVNFLPYSDKQTKFSASVGFMSVSGLSIQTEPIPYREGGYQTTVHYIPGQQTFSPITLTRGVTLGSSQHWDWFCQLFDLGYSRLDANGNNKGTADRKVTGDFRCEVSIKVLAHPQSPVKESYDGQTGTLTGATNVVHTNVVQEFRVVNAWPTNIAYSDLQSGDNGILVEQITLVHEGVFVRYGQYNQGNPNYLADPST